jgi:hypothetical protein
MVLKNSVNRWMNIVLGVIATVALFVGFIQRTIAGHSIAMLIDYFLAFIATALIAYHAWKIPKQET